MSETRCMLDVQVIKSPQGPYLAVLPIHRPRCAHAPGFMAALEAFIDGPAEPWMEGRWWAGEDGGVLHIGSRAKETGRLEVPLGVPRADRASRHAVRSRRDFYGALGLDWSTVSGTRHAVYGNAVLVHRYGAAPALLPIPVDYVEFVEGVAA